MSRPAVRIGHGYDAHRFADGRALVLGGVTVEHPRGLAGHSDADVLSHAVTDALLGAMNLGDMGRHFPSSDPRWRDANSIEMLRDAVSLVAAAGGEPAQVDCTVYLQAPKLSAHFTTIRENLAGALGIGVEYVSVKATTTDGLGFVGREEGAAATAIMLVSVGVD